MKKTIYIYIQKGILIFCLCFVHSVFAFIPGTDRYELHIGGNVPFYMGLHTRYNWSTKYYSKLGAGFAIKLFMDLNQDIFNQLGFSKNTQLLTTALANSMVFDFRMGWAMSIYEGPYLELGYNLMAWGKGTVKGNLLNNIKETKDLSNDTNYHISILNHGPAFYMGYRFILVDKLTLNMELGIYKPLISQLNYEDNISLSKEEENIIYTLLIEKIWFFSTGMWLSLSF